MNNRKNMLGNLKNISNKTNMNKICKDFDNARGNRTLRFGDFIMFNSLSINEIDFYFVCDLLSYQ